MKNLRTRGPFLDPFKIAIQSLNAAIEQRTDSEYCFPFGVYQVLGCPAWKKAEELVHGGISPLPYMIAESGFLFPCFFGHTNSFYAILARFLQQFAGSACAPQTKGVTLRVRQQKYDRNEPK